MDNYARLLYIDLFSGASGDMLLGALLDLGLSLSDLQAELAKVNFSGYELEVEHQVCCGIRGTRLRVHDVAQHYPARHLYDVLHLIGESALSERVKKASSAVFERLARVEARIHGMPVEQVHFHEIGAVDSLVDIVGFIAGLERLRVEQVFSSAAPLGSGMIETEHGLLPVPAPATLALLAEAGAPTRPHPAQTEILTPTAAALLAELATFEYPPMYVRSVGYGFGHRKLPWPNMVRLWLGEAVEPFPMREQVVLLQCNLDDVTGEILGYTMEQLFASGALDVWFTPVQMKKNRPAIVLSALTTPEQVSTLMQVILRETPTLGLRILPMERVVADRRVLELETPWGPVRVKEKWLNGESVAAAPEYEDCARIAREHGVPLQQVLETAELIARQLVSTPEPPVPANGQ